MIPHGRRIFVLGSGFSASMGLPTLLNLFTEIMNLPERQGYSDKEEVRYALELLYPRFRDLTSHHSYPPFEEFLSRVIAAKDLPFFDEYYWEAKRRSALRLLTDSLAKKSREAESSSLLHEFISRLREGDVIITFNWDNLIERSLYSHGRRVSFLNRDEDSIIVLKLHGSLNWFDIPEDLSLAEPESVLWLTDSVVCTKDYTYYDLWQALDSPPLIIPPILSKRVPEGDFFKGIWHEAQNLLIDGESVTAIGYSIPKDDLQSRNLLSLAWFGRVQKRSANQELQDNLTLIDPNPLVRDWYASEVTTDLDYHQACFNEQLLSVVFT